MLEGMSGNNAPFSQSVNSHHATHHGPTQLSYSFVSLRRDDHEPASDEEVSTIGPKFLQGGQ